MAMSGQVLPIRSRSLVDFQTGNESQASLLPPPSSRAGNIPRFYSRENINEPRSSAPSPETPTESPALDTPGDPVPDHEPESEPELNLEETRSNALHTLSACRTVISTLEITRMYKSRIGSTHWFAFWEKLYDRTLMLTLASRVTQTMRRIDSLFRSVSVDLHRLIMHIEAEIRSTESAQQVLSFLELLEEEVGVRRRQRRKDAATILERLRRGIEKIPIRVTDALFVDLKRGVFALDMRCDYHPGDPVAETRDRMAPAQFINGYEAVAVSPSLYQQWLAGSLNRRPLLPERQGSLELDEGWFAGGHAWDTGYAHPPPPPHVGLSVGHGIGRADGRGAGWYSLESSGLVDW